MTESTDHRAAARTVFDHFDKDGSGDLDLTELADLVAALGGTSTADELAAARTDLDVDGNGRLRFDEMYRWWTRR